MKVVLINHSDAGGGAAVVMMRLLQALQREGIDAKMLVTMRHGSHGHTSQMGSSLANRYRFLAERLGIWLRNGRRRDTLFQIDTATHGYPAHRHPWVRQADVVVLGWVNQASLRIETVERLAAMGKPLVWVMHDMWNCTGLCHHAHSCTRYLDSCHSCPLLHGSAGPDLSTATQQRKASVYASAPIHFVAVSHWLERVCRNSSLMRGASMSVIFNPLPVADWKYEPICDNALPQLAGKTVMVMGARRLDEPIKGLGRLIDTTRHLAQHYPELSARLHLLLYGGIRDASRLGELAIGHTHVGELSDAAQINRLYRRAHIVLSASDFESFGLTLVEGQASGCIPVATAWGGQDDIVQHLHTGYLAADGSPEQLAQGIAWAATQPLSRESLHSHAARRFDTQVVVRQYIELFNSLIQQHGQAAAAAPETKIMI